MNYEIADFRRFLRKHRPKEKQFTLAGYARNLVRMMTKDLLSCICDYKGRGLDILFFPGLCDLEVLSRHLAERKITHGTMEKNLFVSEIPWSYYLHPCCKLYAEELAGDGRTLWINPPTRNPFSMRLSIKNRNLLLFKPLMFRDPWTGWAFGGGR